MPSPRTARSTSAPTAPPRRRSVVLRPYVDPDVEELVGSGLGAELGQSRDRGRASVLIHLPDADVDDRSWLADDRLGATGALALRFLPVERLVVAEDRLEPRDPTPQFTP